MFCKEWLSTRPELSHKEPLEREQPLATCRPPASGLLSQNPIPRRVSRNGVIDTELWGSVTFHAAAFERPYGTTGATEQRH